MNDMRKVIEEKVAAYVPEDQQDENTEFTGTDMISVNDLMFKYTDKTDMCYFYSGIIASTLFGGALPGFCLFFGDMVDEMGASNSNTGVGGLKDSALTLIYFAFFVWAASSLQIFMMAMYAERVAHKVKLDYFMKCIEKDADYFD